MSTVLVTGDAGYVGSHCCKAFAKAGWEVVTFDNLSRGCRDAVRWGPLIEGDPAALVASAEKARIELGWRPEASDIAFIVETALAWQRRTR